MFPIDPHSRTPIFEQIVQGVKEWAILGLLPPGEKVPSVRELSKEMALNPNTIQKAYQELERQGVLCTIRGRGNFICPQVQPPERDAKIQAWKEDFRRLLVEARYLNISKQQADAYFQEQWHTLSVKEEFDDPSH